MLRLTDNSRGSVLVLVTVSVIAMFAIIGLAVDLGWAFYVRKQVRTAADAAALAAVKKAYKFAGAAGPYSCNAMNMDCVSLTPCSSVAANSSNLSNGCQYASYHGFTSGSAGQEVTVQSGANTSVQTGTGLVPVYYYATYTVTQSVPQLFSAITGNGTAVVSARATAAILDSVVEGSLIILNQSSDKSRIGGADNYGGNLYVGGSSSGQAVLVDGNLLMASSCNGVPSTNPTVCTSGNSGVYAGYINSNATVHSNGDILVASGGGVGPKGTWENTPYTPPGWHSAPDPSQDPFLDVAQPPVPSSYAGNVPVPNGILDNTVCANGNCLPGRYYAVDKAGNPTGDPITISGTINFGAGSTGFGEYVIWGGIKGASSDATLNVSPGRYVMAGAKPGNALIDTSTNFNIGDGTSGYGQNADAGELFILTDATYGGRITAPSGLSSLGFGQVLLSAGNKEVINLHGMNQNPTVGSAPPSELQPYKTTLFWWDRRNSLMNLDPSTGRLSSSCTTTTNCTKSLSDPNSPELQIWASSNLHLYGVIYQSRGTWTVLHSGSGYNGPLQLITGAFEVQGGAKLDLGVPSTPLTRRVVALIE